MQDAAALVFRQCGETTGRRFRGGGEQSVDQLGFSRPSGIIRAVELGALEFSGGELLVEPSHRRIDILFRPCLQCAGQETPEQKGILLDAIHEAVERQFRIFPDESVKERPL